MQKQFNPQIQSMMRRFSILAHDWPMPHYDLLLDLNPEEDLLTFRLACLPVFGQALHLSLLPAHRRIYLDYEGPVSNNRGSVVRVAAGKFAVLYCVEYRLVIRCDGQVLSGDIELTWNPQGDGELKWLKE